MSFIPPLRPWELMALLLSVIIVLVVYSYVIYLRYTIDGQEPLSPPFDSGDRG